MATENNWVTNNLSSRFENPCCDLQVTIKPNSFERLNFHDAADAAAHKIYKKYPKLFLSFSGGMDSDYVFHCLVRNRIPFQPIIVSTSGNQLEMQFAIHTCKQNNIAPIIINLSDKDLLEIYKKEVIDKLNSLGIGAIAGIVACRYAKERGGITIIGEHMLDNDDHNIWVGMNDWDFYNEVLVGVDYNVPFFYYTTDLTYAMIENIEPMPIHEWKWNLYQYVGFRPIIEYKFNDKLNALVKNFIEKRKCQPKTKAILGPKLEILKQLESMQ